MGAVTELSGRVAAFVADCRERVAGELRDDAATRVLYSTDASLYQALPHAVLIPRSVEDVAAAVALAAEYGVPVLARAAGTSLAGQAVNEALVIDFTRHLDSIIEINPEERWARVQPGVVLDDLNTALRPHGLQFGPDPAAGDRSTIGGAVANNSTGSHSLLYGMTAGHVRGMSVVLSDGATAVFGYSSSGTPSAAELRIVNLVNQIVAEPKAQQAIREGTPRYWRRCGGYNLDRLTAEGLPNLSPLVCGSEGTLAVMTEITVGLVPRPAHTGLALLHFADLSAALAAVPAILETEPTAVELLDALSLILCRAAPEYARLLASVIEGEPYCLLIVEYQGESEAAVSAGVELLAARVRRQPLGVTRLTPALAPAAQSAVWRVRKAGLGLLMSLRSDMKPIPFIEDAAVPVEHLPEYVRRIEEYCAGLDTPISYYGHAGAGCLHIRPLINRRSAAQIARMPDIARFSVELVRGYGGALSSEHGDGRARSWLNESFYGPELYDLFRRVKRAFDPHNLLNPGVIVDARPMTESLRPLASDPERPRLSFADYEDKEWGGGAIRLPAADATARPADGFARAVEMCNGAGVCRQRITGTMCPSFMVTREEAHSTRGRANALRAAMSGVLLPHELTGPRLYAIMDLCIGCKACKAECPSAVDMARLKVEFLARYHEAHGIPLRARFFGHSAALTRLGGGRAAPLANAALRSAVGRGLAARLGLAPQRPLPVLARTTFSVWWKRRGDGSSKPGEGKGGVVLLIDPFTDANEPAVGVAAVEVLAALGVNVVAAPVLDEGRALLSQGLIAPARRAAERTARTLWPWVAAGHPIVGLEPSSLLMLRDEYLYLLADAGRAKALAERALTFEEYVAGLPAAELIDRFTAARRTVLLHGHCHQKALVGTAAARRVLALPAGYTVEEIDSGCCGMAGAFGFEAEHYELSYQMAERRLLPVVRAAAPETIIAAAGMSCRRQIADGGGRVALHPAQVLHEALRGKSTDFTPLSSAAMAQI